MSYAITTSRLGIWAGWEQRTSLGCDLHREHQTSHSGGVFNRGMRLCWNGKYGGSGPTSSLGHRAWRKANSDSTGRTRRRYNRPRCVSRLESMTWGRTRRETPFPQSRMPASIENFNKASCLGPDAPRSAEHQRGRLGERGGAGHRWTGTRGAVDQGERGVLTDRMTADCGGVGPNITYVGRTSGMDGLTARLQD